MQKHLIKIFLYSLIFTCVQALPLSATEHACNSKLLKQAALLHRKLLNGSSEDKPSPQKKNLFVYSLDDKKRIVSVTNKKEKATVKFPYQGITSFETEFEEGVIWVGYGSQNFLVCLDYNETQLEQELSALIAACEEEGLEYTFEMKKNHAIIDYTTSYVLDYSYSFFDTSGLSFQLEYDFTQEPPSDVLTVKTRAVFTKKNIYFLFSWSTNADDFTLHEKLIQTLKIHEP